MSGRGRGSSGAEAAWPHDVHRSAPRRPTSLQPDAAPTDPSLHPLPGRSNDRDPGPPVGSWSSSLSTDPCSYSSSGLPGSTEPRVSGSSGNQADPTDPTFAASNSQSSVVTASNSMSSVVTASNIFTNTSSNALVTRLMTDVQESSRSSEPTKTASNVDSAGPEVDADISRMPVLMKREPAVYLTRLKQDGEKGRECQLRDLLLMRSTEGKTTEADSSLQQLSGRTSGLRVLEAAERTPSTGTPALSLPGQQGRSASSQEKLDADRVPLPAQPPRPASSSERLGPDPRPEDDGSHPGWKKVRHKKRVTGRKICLVCGDRALAHNFDVITCESCKAFFRRNALKAQSHQRCMFVGNCAIDKNTRRFCPSCRLKKCFHIGMKPELMLDDAERRLRQEKKAQRIGRREATPTNTAASYSNNETKNNNSSNNASSCSITSTTNEGQFGSTSITTTTTIAIVDLEDTPRLSDSIALPPSSSSVNSLSSPEVQIQGPSSPRLPLVLPLPSFHTLRDSVPASPSTPSHSSSLSASPWLNTPQPSSEEHSPFHSVLSHLYTFSQSPAMGSHGSEAVHGLEQSLSRSASLEMRASPSTLNPSPSRAAKSAPGLHHLEDESQPQQEGEEGAGYSCNDQTDSSYSLPRQRSAGRVENSMFHCLPGPEGDLYNYIQQTDPSASFLRPENSGRADREKSMAHRLPGPGARLFKHVPRDLLPSDPFMYWIVSGEERLLLANLTITYQDQLLCLAERSLRHSMPISDTYFIHDFLNEIDDAMYKIVQFSKHVPDFRCMRKEDQIAMLKSSAMQALGVACCAAYVHERDSWLSLRGDLTLAHLRKLTDDDPYIQIGVEYCRSVKSLVKNDFTIYALIHCMILFDPSDAKIVDRQQVNQSRDKYVILLKHYLESQFSYLYADEYFVAIQERVREMCYLAQSGNALFKRYSSAFQPLITEMLSST